MRKKQDLSKDENLMKTFKSPSGEEFKIIKRDKETYLIENKRNGLTYNMQVTNVIKLL